jgi:hypothetical protein
MSVLQVETTANHSGAVGAGPLTVTRQPRIAAGPMATVKQRTLLQHRFAWHSYVAGAVLRATLAQTCVGYKKRLPDVMIEARFTSSQHWLQADITSGPVII